MKSISLMLIAMMFVITAAARDSKRKGAGMSGKVIFSTQQFGNVSAVGKKSFTSHDFIYGRIELPGGSIKEAFKLKESADNLSYLKYAITVLQNGEEIGSDKNNYILVKNNDMGKTSLNFDVLPEPSKATTTFSMLDDFSAGIGFVPLYTFIWNNKLAEGDYTVRIRLYSEVLDGWGNEQPEEKWPFIEDEFNFHFDDADAERITKNKDLVADAVKENSFRYEKLPDVFSNGATITDPVATNTKIMAILKRDLPERTIVKMAIEKTSGVLWHVAKDDIDIPKYRYFNPDVWVVYKMNGKCYIGTVTLRENYEGGGNYGPLQVGFTSAGNQPDRGIDCDKVK